MGVWLSMGNRRHMDPFNSNKKLPQPLVKTCWAIFVLEWWVTSLV